MSTFDTPLRHLPTCVHGDSFYGDTLPLFCSYHGKGDRKWIPIGCSGDHSRYAQIILVVVSSLDITPTPFVLSEIASSMTKALHFNTYGGNPMACTVGSAVLDVSVMVHHVCTWCECDDAPCVPGVSVMMHHVCLV